MNKPECCNTRCVCSCCEAWEKYHHEAQCKMEQWAYKQHVAEMSNYKKWIVENLEKELRTHTYSEIRRYVAQLIQEIKER